MRKAETVDAALDWLERDVSVVPVRFGSKVPMLKWSRWIRENQPRPMVEFWFRNMYPCNVGIVLKNGLCVLDFDSMLAYANWSLEMPHMTETLTVNTSRGKHVYLKLEDYKPSTFHIDGGELKCNGIVIVPPSLHRSGREYSFVNKNARILGRAGMDDLGVRILGEKKFEKSCQNSGQDTGVVRKVKENIGIDVFLNRFTDLRANGDGSLVGLCPFHEDHNPSLQVFPKEGRCYCHAPHCIAHRKTDVIAAAAYIFGVSMSAATMLLVSEL